MKRITASFLIASLLLSCCLAQVKEKYIPGSARKQQKLATAEPGTYLKPMALTVLHNMNKAIEDSCVREKSMKWMKRLPASEQKKIMDSVLVFEGLEIPVRIYYPSRKSMKGTHPVILYFHGGGFILGSVEQYHLMVCKLASVTGQIVVSVDYRLAPEHPFPAAINDSYAVLRWMQQFGPGLGADTTRITLMGDSAGGNIATVLTLLCRDNHTPQPRCQVLLYPGLTFMDTEYPSIRYFLRDPNRCYVLSESFLRRVRRDYGGSDSNYINPYISPLEAELSDDLPPALIITAECDPLRDSGREYALRLEESGVDVHYLEYSGMIHAFMSFHMLLGDARHAMKEVRDYLGDN